MIRLLTMVVLLSLSTFGWASAYEGVPNTFKDGDTIKAVDFNTNNRGDCSYRVDMCLGFI
jgi:hypothetical protein